MTARTQWFGVEDAPDFQTLSLHTYLGPIAKVGVGAIINDKNGYHSKKRNATWGFFGVNQPLGIFQGNWGEEKMEIKAPSLWGISRGPFLAPKNPNSGGKTTTLGTPGDFTETPGNFRGKSFMGGEKNFKRGGFGGFFYKSGGRISKGKP